MKVLPTELIELMVLFSSLEVFCACSEVEELLPMGLYTESAALGEHTQVETVFSWIGSLSLLSL